MFKMKLISLFCACLVFQSLAAQSNRDSILHVKSTTDFQFTGTGAEENWKAADWITLTARTPAPAWLHNTNQNSLFSYGHLLLVPRVQIK
jgi:hypothetical protein